MTDIPAAINHGRWIGYCPVNDTHALALTPGVDTVFVCPYCAFTGPVVWPVNGPQIAAALADRPESNRNWYPAGHEWASKYAIPTGQSVTDLQAETAAEATAAATEASRQQELTDTLAGLGYVIDPTTMTLREI